MIREITTLEELEKLANSSMPCWEGLTLNGLEEQLKEIDPDVKVVFCKGKTYSDAYGLTGSNRYPDDLNIVFIEDFRIPMMAWKLDYGCRWADDVRDNNLSRENR